MADPENDSQDPELNIDSEKTRGDEPTEPGPPSQMIPWNEERVQMKQVIDLLMKQKHVLERQKSEMKVALDQAHQHLQKYQQQNQQTSVEDEFQIIKGDVKFTDIGGLEPVLYLLRDFQHSISRPEQYSAYGIEPPKSLLMYGPPGCGKTMIGKALSNELDCRFLDLPVTSFISKWVGEAERKLEAKLAECVDVYRKKGERVVVFFDEAEQIFGARGQSMGHRVMDRCLTVILRYMDGTVDDEGLIYLAATNRKDDMDEAMLRDGRFDNIVNIPYPDREGVEEILQKQVAYRSRMAGGDIFRIHDYSAIADTLHANGANGANIAAILKNILRQQARQDRADVKRFPDGKLIPPPVYQFQLEEAIKYHDFRSGSRREKRVGFI